MAYQLTSAAGWRDLLTVVRTFALAQGWTSVYDQIAAKGQMGIQKGNCRISLGCTRNSGDTADANTYARSDLINGGTVPDADIVMALAQTLVAGTTRYWGHTGSLVTTSTDGDRVIVNDLAAANFPNVWLFSPADGNAISVVVQTGADKFAQFSFGELDVRGLDQPRCGYAVGGFFTFWPNNSSFTNTGYSPNSPSSGNHSWGFLGDSTALNCFIPSGVLNTGFTQGITPPVIVGASAPTINTTMTRSDNRANHVTNNAGGRLLDFYMAVGNQQTTGGVPLHALPFMYENGTSETGIMTWLGELPDIRLVSMAGLNPGQEIRFGADIWTVFPWKRKGSPDNLRLGANPQAALNTGDYGLAFKKVV